LNFESTYYRYIGELIENMVHDRVMYAELRLVHMPKQMPSDDGLRQLDSTAQMRAIAEEV
jgi:adenosine deaminase CECR1